MYIANINFKSDGTMYRRGDEVPHATQAHIRKGLVREAKIIKPEALTDAPVQRKRGRKPKIAVELAEQSDN